MTTRMTLLSNPRLAVFGLIMLLLLGAGIALFFLLTPIYGIVGTGIAAFVDWTMLKILRRQMRTTVTVDDDGARFNLYGEERIDIPWPEATLVGLAVEEGKRGRGARQLFFYTEGVDRLMVVPTDFARFEDFVEETRRRSPTFRDIALAAGETLKVRLRTLIAPPQGSTPQPASGSPSEPAAERSNDPAAGAPGPA